MYGNKKAINATDYTVAFLLLTAISTLCLSQTPFAYADSDGPNYANSVLATPWKGETAAIGSGNSVCATSKGDETGYWQNFGFKIPSDAAITGIKALVDSSQSGSNSQIVINVGKDSKSFGSSEFKVRPSVGNCASSKVEKLGTSELWGLSWTPEEINNKTFGVQVKSDLGNSILYLDSIGIIVDYTTSSTTEDPISISTPSINLIATTLSQSIINLSWSPPSESYKITSYIIERKSSDQNDYTVIDNVVPRFLTYSDTSLLGSTEYQYRVSAINSAGVISSSDTVSATTISFMNSKKNTATDPPSTSNIDFVIRNGTQTMGFSQRLTGYTVIPTQIMQTGAEQQLQIRVSDNAGIATIKHVGVLMYFDDDDIIKKGDTYFVYDEGVGLTVSDPLGFFDDVQAYRTFTKTEMILQFIFTPQKPMPVTDLVINGWDDELNSKSAIIPNAIEIKGQGVSISALTEQVPEYVIPKLNYIIDSDGNMVPYDAFGKLDNKFLRTVAEPFAYPSKVGKSYRFDDGFYDKVSEERVKAKKIADTMIKQSDLTEPEKTFKTDKVFKYPSNVGKSDRRDVQSIKMMMDKESTKAQERK